LIVLLTGVALAADEWGEIVIPPNAPVKITVGAAISGGYANFGIDIKNGCEMAILEKGRSWDTRSFWKPATTSVRALPPWRSRKNGATTQRSWAFSAICAAADQ